MARRAAVLLAALAAIALAAPATALAHASLLGTTPERGDVLLRSPAEIVFRFSEPVEAAFGAVRVFDAHERRVDDGRVFHPGGHGDQVAVGLRGRLPAGAYTAAYRVISADGHPVSGGITFGVGNVGGQAAPSVAAVLGRGGTGPVTDVVLGIARGATYLATALTLGVLAFLVLVWSRALAATATGAPSWSSASHALGARARRLLVAGAVLGVIAGAVGIVAQGAVAAGVSWWSAADPSTVGKVLSTRFGLVWGLRLLLFAALAAAVAALMGRRRSAAPVPAVLLPAALLLGVAPALAGHATTEHPIAVLAPLDVAHVLAMSAWIGGLVALLGVVPAATRRLEGADRSRALAAVLVRFSPLALACVVVLAVSGVAQAYVEVRHLDALTSTAFGRSVLIKAALLLALVALAAVNRRRVVPALTRIAARGESPAATGVLLRRTLRGEVALLAVVLGVTAALVSYAPPVSLARGPFSATKRMGPVEADVTVDPATVGANRLHVYLFDARTGAQFDRTEELIVTVSQPHRAIGSIDVRMRKAGPGHYVSDGLLLVPGGEWDVEIIDRVSDFDEYTTTVQVPVRR